MIVGLTELERDLVKLGKTNLRPGIEKAIQFVQGAAKAAAPSRDGELRGSIFTEVEETGDRIVGRCYTNKKYAPYVEFGTGPKGQKNHNGISPDVTITYSQSPWWIHEGSGDNEVDRATGERYHWFYVDTDKGRFYQTSGQPAMPFMYPALKDNEEAVMKIIRENAL